MKNKLLLLLTVCLLLAYYPVNDVTAMKTQPSLFAQKKFIVVQAHFEGYASDANYYYVQIQYNLPANSYTLTVSEYADNRTWVAGTVTAGSITKSVDGLTSSSGTLFTVQFVNPYSVTTTIQAPAATFMPWEN